MDELLSLIQTNKTKYTLLEKIVTLEINNQTNCKEYLELINLYKLTAKMYDNKLKGIEEVKRCNILNNIKSLNPIIINQIIFSELLSLPKECIVLKRIIADLKNTSLLNLYDQKISERNTIIPYSFLNLLGLQEDKEDFERINGSLVNEYMNQDFINTFYIYLQYNLENIESNSIKQKLLNYKCNLILLFDFLEQRMLMTNFSIPKNTKLIDQMTIETTGITIEKYIGEIDEISISNIEIILKNIALKGNEENITLNAIILNTFLGLISDKEYLESFKLELVDLINNKDEIGNFNIDLIEEMLKFLEIGKDIKIGNKENRQYTKI